jgi:hypothetical protein
MTSRLIGYLIVVILIDVGLAVFSGGLGLRELLEACYCMSQAMGG